MSLQLSFLLFVRKADGGCRNVSADEVLQTARALLEQQSCWVWRCQAADHPKTYSYDGQRLDPLEGDGVSGGRPARPPLAAFLVANAHLLESPVRQTQAVWQQKACCPV